MAQKKLTEMRHFIYRRATRKELIWYQNTHTHKDLRATDSLNILYVISTRFMNIQWLHIFCKKILDLKTTKYNVFFFKKSQMKRNTNSTFYLV